jgi:DMSO/TMAO reductase YedYZ molybdopterin-dependent catalytic subunit
MSIDRRRLLARSGALASAVLLGGCDRLSQTPWFVDVLAKAEALTHAAQRLLVGDALAPEFPESAISPQFRANGSTDPQSDDYRALVANGFSDWRLKVGGLVQHPAEFSLADLRAMPSRTQITRHDCVEGWSCIGKWTGVPLAQVLARVGVQPQANYVVFYCADDMGPDSGSLEAKEPSEQAGATGVTAGPAPGETVGTHYYESIAMRDALHAQTILAYAMNDAPLPVAYGAPLRVRIERQLGYKMAKYVMRIELVERLDDIGDGKGGYWEDRGYEWYAGI